MKPFENVLSGVGKGCGGDDGGDLTNVQYKSTRNCHNESSLYNEYMLIKMGKKSNKKDSRYILKEKLSGLKSSQRHRKD
jgi:hypothetical protein